jgi:hypothetical protein
LKILIAGLAKTGTTGLLYLIANSLEPRPRLLFEPKKCPPDLDQSPGHVVGKLLIGPRLDAQSFSHFDRKITLARDPRDRLVSALLYSQYHARYLDDDSKVAIVRDCLEKKEAAPARVSLREIFDAMEQASGSPGIGKRFRSGAATALTWLDDYIATMRDGLVYQYERFVSGDYAPLERHLGMRLAGAAKVPARMHRIERTRGYGDWRHWFTEEDIHYYRPAFAPWLARYGYDADDWALDSEPVIAREHCSGYYMRLVAEYRAKQVARLHGERGGASRLLLTGRLLRARPKVVAGWAIGPDPATPARVALRVNGREVAQVVADRPRPPLKQRGIHPTGNCGFAFEMKAGEPLRVGDEVTVVPVDGGFALEGSPRVVSADG